MEIHSLLDTFRAPKNLPQPDYTLAAQQENSDQYQCLECVDHHNPKADSYLVEIRQVHSMLSKNIFCRIDPFYAHLPIAHISNCRGQASCQFLKTVH